MRFPSVRDVEAIPGLELRRGVAAWTHWLVWKTAERCHRIVSHPWEFPELQTMFTNRKLSRERRIERRKALALTSAAQMLRTDIASKRIGIPDEGFIRGLSVQSLACDWTGLAHSGAADKRGRRGRRVERACGDLNQAGYHKAKRDKRNHLRASQPIDRETLPNGQRRFRGLPAIRVVAPVFLERLGVAEEWAEVAKKRREDEADAAWLEAKRTQEHRASQLGALFKAPPVKRRPVVDPSVDDEAARELVRVQLDVRRANPTWTPDDQRAEALRLVALRRRGTGPPE